MAVRSQTKNENRPVQVFLNSFGTELFSTFPFPSFQKGCFPGAFIGLIFSGIVFLEHVFTKFVSILFKLQTN